MARADATDAFANLWKRHGGELHTLGLSRQVHGHWREAMMLSGGDGACIRRLAPALNHGGAALDVIDLSEQQGLKGPVLEIMFVEWAHAIVRSLRTLSLYRCKGITGAIPAAIGDCLMLRTLNLYSYQCTGTSDRMVCDGLDDAMMLRSMLHAWPFGF